MARGTTFTPHVLPRGTALRDAIATVAAVPLSRLIGREATRGVAPVARAPTDLAAMLLVFRRNSLVIPRRGRVGRAPMACCARRVVLDGPYDAAQFLCARVSLVPQEALQLCQTYRGPSVLHDLYRGRVSHRMSDTAVIQIRGCIRKSTPHG